MLQNIALITNIPSPYRVLQFDKLNNILDGNLIVIYYQKTEQNRNWEIPDSVHNSVLLKHTFLSRINFYPDIFKHIRNRELSIIITAGFTLTIISAFIYSKISKKKFVVFTDSWLHPVSKLKFYHRIVRRFIIPRADACVCVGIKGGKFLVSYGAKENSIFISPLAIDNSYYIKYYKPFTEKEFDIIFSGQFIPRKMPFFVIKVLHELKKKNKGIKFLIIGSGPLEIELIKQLEANKIDYSFPGFIQQVDLPRYYANAKVLLFPTQDDPWGLVANEACAVGTPVITCENAGVAGDLIIHGYNGFILPLIVEVWVEHISKLLSDFHLYEQFSKNALSNIQKYSIENAADGIKDAINHLLANERS